MKQRPSFHNSVVPPPPPVSTTTLMQDSKDSRPATTTTFATEAKLPIHQKYNNNGFGGSSMNGITSSTSKGEVVGLFDSKSSIGIGIFVAVTLLFSLNLKEMPMLVFCTILCTSGFVLADRITRFIETQPKGTTEMQSVVDAVRQGAEGFFKTQYGTIFRMTGIVSVIIFVSYLYRPLNDAQAHISPVVLASITTLCFVFGAMCSTLAGYAGLYICVRANGRVAGCARRSFKDAMQIALLSGAVPALLVIGLVVIGIVFLYALLTNFVVGQEQSQKNPAEVPLLLVGYGFGASFVALFAQLGGGIYTKAADVGADLVGKGEFDLDEDDPRNPAVVADLVGDNVGDCAGRGADLFESIAAEIVSAMILGGTMASSAKLPSSGFVMFPVMIHGFDLVVSSIGVLAAYNAPTWIYRLRRPLLVLKVGFAVTLLCSVVFFYVSCQWLLYVPDAPNAANRFFGCGLLGIGATLLMVLITQYYTDYTHWPVQSIAKAAMSGHATAVISGISVGTESTAMPTIVMSIALLGSYYLGESSGVVDFENGLPIGGLFGTAVATMGMLSSACFVLCMDFFGPISDNAGGIVEMASEPSNVREVTDLLDTVGNTTKAATKGFAVGSGFLACFLLFSAFMDEVEAFTSEEFRVVDIAVPEVFVGGALGATLVFVFTSWTLLAVGRAAEELVNEVRRQFKQHPGILKGTQKPNYKECVSIANKAALREMIRPGGLAVVAPIVVGLTFKMIGVWKKDALLGPKAVAGFLMFATVSGVMMALTLSNSGGAFDNAKKYVETGKHGGKNSEAHKATVTGDTVGDPFKDTAGPSLHVLIKLLSTITLVIAPMFMVNTSKTGEHVILPTGSGSGNSLPGAGGGDNNGEAGMFSSIFALFTLLCLGLFAWKFLPRIVRRFRRKAKRANQRLLV